MSDPFIGEIKMISFNFPPKGWAFCNGQLLPINQNQALFSILGTTYGGNGRTTFALPNLQGRVPLHQGNGFTLGERGGEAAAHADINEMPAHTHPARASRAADRGQPGRHHLGTAPTCALTRPTPNAHDEPAAIGNAGGSQPHENHAPYLVLNFVIALQGIFPSRRTRPTGANPMTDPFLAEIRMFGGNFAPTGWALCNGQLMSDLAEHRALLAARHHLRR